MRYLLDSDHFIDDLKGRPSAIELLRALIRHGVAVSAVTLGEVFEGTLYGRDPNSEEQALRQFLRAVTILTVDADVAYQFAIVRGDLRRQGLLIPQFDLLIAATAIQHDLTLVTRNRRHYDRIPGLTLYEDNNAVAPANMPTT